MPWLDAREPVMSVMRKTPQTAMEGVGVRSRAENRDAGARIGLSRLFVRVVGRGWFVGLLVQGVSGTKESHFVSHS